MKILITNHRLRHRGGSELFVLEIGRALREREHDVCVFSTVPGEVSEAIEEAGIPVVADPADCPFTPDIIHGQHHLETMTAIAAWPGVPAIFHMHGAGPWEEEPPMHPRLLKYFSTTPRMAWWIARRCGIAEHEIGTIWNFFDSARFPNVREPGTRTGRALVFLNNLSRESPSFLELEKACGEAGLELDGIGTKFGRTVDDPGAVLPDYDLVFAGGRSGIEAMACGCASIPITRETMADRVHPGNFDKLRKLNFCADANDSRIEAARALEVIRGIDVAETAKVTDRIRREATLEATVNSLLREYANVKGMFALQTAPDPVEESAAVGKYLCGLAAHVKNADERSLRIVEKNSRLESRAQKWKEKAERYEERLDWLEREFEKGPWWFGRRWRRLRREWESGKGRDPQNSPEDP